MPLDPVCGMSVDPANAAGAFDYKSTKYYFCSKHCLQSFQSDPERYLGDKADHADHGHDSGHHAASIPVAAKPSTSPAKPGRESGTQYTCPMHPEVVQAGPGSCPKCGMALVPMVTAVSAASEYTCPMHPEVR